MASLSKVVIFDERLYLTGHMANRWMALMTHRFEGHAKRRAPRRSGNLKRRIRSNSQQVGVRKLEGTITSGARYSTYVLKGTHGPIYPINGPLLKLRPGPGYPRTTAAKQVAGQRANNFLAQAWRDTARTHSCLRGKAFPGL